MRDRRPAASTSAALAVLLVAGLTTGSSVAATGDGLGVRTEATVVDSAPETATLLTYLAQCRACAAFFTV